jgi:hypothetical protein
VDRPLRVLTTAVIVLSMVILLVVATTDTVQPGLNDTGSGLSEPTECVGSSIDQGNSPEGCDEKLPLEGETGGSEQSGGDGS